MKVTIESTDRIVEVNGVPARIWEGRTDTGVPVVACITRIAAPVTADLSQFDRELQETKPATDLATSVFPARMIL